MGVAFQHLLGKHGHQHCVRKAYHAYHRDKRYGESDKGDAVCVGETLPYVIEYAACLLFRYYRLYFHKKKGNYNGRIADGVD